VQVTYISGLIQASLMTLVFFLDLLALCLPKMKQVSSWRQMYQTPEWSTIVSVHSSLTRHDYATSGTEAVAVALWSLVTNWYRPEQAVIVSATLAGSVPVTSQITGTVKQRFKLHQLNPVDSCCAISVACMSWQGLPSFPKLRHLILGLISLQLLVTLLLC
jgi:hypothetical protein